MNIIVPENIERERLDSYLAQHGFGTRSQLQRALEDGRVVVNNEICLKASYRVKSGDTIVVTDEVVSTATYAEAAEESKEILEKIRIIHEDLQYIVVEKPAGLLVHPTEANEQVTLSSWAVSKYPEIAKVGESDMRPGIVHRLDREASGLLVIARTQKMFEHLKSQFKNREIEKVYTVLVYGEVPTQHGEINFIIDRGRDGKMIARPNTQMTLKNVTQDRSGKDAVTEFEILQKFVRYTLLSVRIHTGRMHQIRVHMYAYNHPVVGDTLYMHKRYIKKNDPLLNRLFLHASKLGFTDLKNTHVLFECPLPFELESYLQELT